MKSIVSLYFLVKHLYLRQQLKYNLIQQEISHLEGKHTLKKTLKWKPNILSKAQHWHFQIDSRTSLFSMKQNHESRVCFWNSFPLHLPFSGSGNDACGLPQGQVAGDDVRGQPPNIGKLFNGAEPQFALGVCVVGKQTWNIRILLSWLKGWRSINTEVVRIVQLPRQCPFGSEDLFQVLPGSVLLASYCATVARVLELKAWIRRNKNQWRLPFQNLTFMLNHNCNVPLICQQSFRPLRLFLKGISLYTLTC